MSSDFFEIVLPNPVFSVEETGLIFLRGPASEPTGFWLSDELA